MYHAIRARYSRILLALILGVSAAHLPLAAQVRSILIHVVDAVDGQPVTAAVLHLGKQYSQTNASGQARLELKAGERASLSLHAVGYHDMRLSASRLISSGDSCLIRLMRDERLVSGVTISGLRRHTSVNSVATKISDAAMERNLGRSLAQLLTEVSGVTTLQTGTTTAKPVIHGMYGTRVLIVNNGVRQSGQQWGEDHAPEVDIEGSSSIQVVKGAEAVRYGAEAMAGAVLLDAAPLPYQQTKLHGRLGTAFATNGRRSSTNLSLEAALPQLPSLAWRLQTSYTNAGDRRTPHYALTNTGLREFNYSLGLGWRREALKIEGLFSRYQNKTALLPTGHLGNRGSMAYILEAGRPDPDLERPFSRSISSPYHSVVHYLAKLKANYYSDRWGDLLVQGSHQWDRRQEYAVRRNQDYQNIPTLSLALQSTQLEGRWHKHYKRWDSEVGLHWESMDNHNVAGTGFVPPIPNYAQRSWGIHALQRYSATHYGAELGLRLDQLAMGVAGYDIQGNYFDGDHHFTNLTYSLSGHLDLGSGWRVTSNFGLAWRAPHVQELYSLGSMHGSAIFVYGKRDLVSERGYKWVTSLSHQGERLSCKIDGYLQWIDGYIYDEPQKGEYTLVITGEYPTFRYKQSDAFFRGFDLDARYYLLPQRLYLGAKGSMVWANERGTGRYYPYIPALRLSQELGLQLARCCGGAMTLAFNHRSVAKQYRFDPLTDLTTSPEGYQLWGIEASYTRPLGKQSLSLNLSVDNLLDTEYKEYTNRARYYSHDVGRDIRLALHWKF